MVSRSLLVLAGVTLGLSVTTAARADDTWTDPFPGVRHLHRVTSDQDINVLRVELCAAGIAFRATKESEQGKTTSAFATSVGAQVAVNGDFFKIKESFDLERGIAVGDGVAWAPSATPEDESVGQIAFGDDRVELIRDSVLQSVEPWMKNVVGGRPTLLFNGEKTDTSVHAVLCQKNPRTAVGLDKSKNVVFLVVVDGRAATRVGMTCPELADLMKDLGAYNALAFDGGGSSTMWLEGKGVLNHPTDGSERVVSNHLALFAKGQGKPASCEAPPTGTLEATCADGIKGSLKGAPDPVELTLTFDADPGTANAKVLPAPTTPRTDCDDAGVCGVDFQVAIPAELQDGHEHLAWATFKGRPADVVGTAPVKFTCGTAPVDVVPSTDAGKEEPSAAPPAATEDGCQAAPGTTGGLFAKLAGGMLLASLLERTRRRRAARSGQA